MRKNNKHLSGAPMSYHDDYNPSMISLHLENEEATLNLGRQLATHLRPGLTIFLQGDLGAGKTTLVRGLLRGLEFVIFEIGRIERRRHDRTLNRAIRECKAGFGLNAPRALLDLLDACFSSRDGGVM